MDGGKAKLTGSLQFRLSASLSVLVAVLALTAGMLSYRTAFEDAIEWQDGNLRQMSAMTDGKNATVDVPTTIVDTIPDPDLQVVVAVISPGNTAPLGPALKIAHPLRQGMQTVQVGEDGWRVYARPLADGNRLVVAQRSAERDEIARDSALRAVLPLAALLPVMVVLIGMVVTRTLRPLTMLSRDLDQRSPTSVGALGEGPVPNELRPFVASINKLLARLGIALQAQRRFIADAAHELRSPLTALTLQAEQLALRLKTPEEGECMGRLQDGMQRLRALLDQLLTLASAEMAAGVAPNALSVVLRHVIEEELALADATDVDLGVVGELEDMEVPGRASDLHALFRNLVNNAVRYTPAGGRVDISMHRQRDEAVVRIVDDGPGIPATERHRVFDPFYRIVGTEPPGSGLGLAIVRVVADRLGGSVTLAGRADRPGLHVTVSLPLMKPS